VYDTYGKAIMLFGFSLFNLLLFFVYPVTLISLSMYVSHAKEVTVDSFFFASRNTDWFILGIFFLTTVLCSPYMLGAVSPGAVSWLPLAYGISSVLVLLVLGWYIAPPLIKLKITTLPEYFERRFTRSSKIYLASLYLVSNVFIRMMCLLVVGNIFMTTISGINAYSSLLFFLVVTGLYVIIGGLKAEIHAGVIQMIFAALGAVVFIGWIVLEGGGAHVGVNHSSLTNAVSQFSWIEAAFGLPVLAFGFWCTDQCIVQKMLRVHNAKTVKKAVVFSSALQIIPIVIFMLPSLIALVLSHNISDDGSFHSLLFGGSMPDSVRCGVSVGGASVLMLSFATLFTSTSSLFTFDIYRGSRPEASDRTLVLVGRMTTMVMLFISILLIPVCQSMNFDMCLSLVKILVYLSAMILSVAALGMLSKNITAANALLAFTVGTLVVLVRATFELFYADAAFENHLVQWIARSGFLEFTLCVFTLTTGLLIASSALGHLYNVSRVDKNASVKEKEYVVR
jgi:solute:Na+ symporter, SSS family